MKEMIDNVVSVVTTAGDIVGKVVDVSDDGVVKLFNPRLFYVADGQNGQLAVAPSTSATAIPFVEFSYISIHSVVTIALASDDAAAAWNNANKPEIKSVSATH